MARNDGRALLAVVFDDLDEIPQFKVGQGRGQQVIDDEHGDLGQVGKRSGLRGRVCIVNKQSSSS